MSQPISVQDIRCLFQNVVLLTYFDIAQHFIYHSYIIEWKIDESKGFAPWCGNIVDGIIAWPYSYGNAS